MKKTYAGINIQYPISQLILEGKKTIETRTYPIPKKYLGQALAFIETPGKQGKFKARIVGLITFSECFQYKNKTEFYKDRARHCVSPESPWRWDERKPKWGWTISSLKILKPPKKGPVSKGIIFTANIDI